MHLSDFDRVHAIKVRHEGRGAGRSLRLVLVLRPHIRISRTVDDGLFASTPVVRSRLWLGDDHPGYRPDLLPGFSIRPRREKEKVCLMTSLMNGGFPKE